MVSKGRAYYNAEAWQQVAGRNQKLKVHSFKTKTQCKDSELEEKEGLITPKSAPEIHFLLQGHTT